MWDFCRLTAAVLETVSGWAVCAAIRLRFQVFFSRFRSCQTASSPIISARRGNKTRQLRCTEVGVDAQVNDKNYHPSDREPFMNERQREYFRNKLLAWKEDILKEAQETLQHLQDENQNHPDFRRSRLRGDGAGDRAAGARSSAQADRQDRCCPAAHRRWYLRLLRGDRRADLAATPRSAPDRNPVDHCPGGPRTARTRLSRRLIVTAPGSLPESV